MIDPKDRKIKLPESFYVGFQSRAEGILAFMTPDGTDAAAQKRKSTVDFWAKNRSHGDPEGPASKVIKNEALEGFEILSDVHRWSTENKLIRVLDPRGFQAEISVSNLCMLLKETTTVKGRIEGQLVWARLGAQNVLILVESEIYLTAKKNTQLSSIQIKSVDVHPGHIVRFKNGSYGVYLGVCYHGRLEFGGDRYAEDLHIENNGLVYVFVTGRDPDFYEKLSFWCTLKTFKSFPTNIVSVERSISDQSLDEIKTLYLGSMSNDSDVIAEQMDFFALNATSLSDSRIILSPLDIDSEINTYQNNKPNYRYNTNRGAGWVITHRSTLEQALMFGYDMEELVKYLVSANLVSANLVKRFSGHISYEIGGITTQSIKLRPKSRYNTKFVDYYDKASFNSTYLLEEIKVLIPAFSES